MDTAFGGSVTVAGLDTTSPMNCSDKSFQINLTDASGRSLAEVTGTTPGSGDTIRDLAVPIGNAAADDTLPNGFGRRSAASA